MANFHIIETGYFFADGGAMFGPIPKKYWQKRYPCNHNNMCLMTMRCLFIETDDRKILVDCGAGDKQLDKLKYYQPHNLKNLVTEIENIGYMADEVTDVVLTHLHFDHCGGGTVFNDKGEVVPTFPKATYWLSQAQWKNYRNPVMYEKSSFFTENIEPVYETGQLRLIDSETNICENINLKLYDGHTPGQIAVFFDNDSKKIVFPADIVPTSAHLPYGWLSAYDNNAALAMEEKKRFFDELKTENAMLIFFHDTYTKTMKI